MTLDSNDRSYYVYSHKRKDTGEVFYYGKGKGRRAYEPWRNKWHDAIVKKFGFEVEILKSGLTDEEAKAEEIKLIAETSLKLTNQTPGGDGVGGEASIRGGTKSRLNKTGIHAPGVSARGGSAAAKVLMENKIGLFGRSKQKMTEDGKKAGRVMVEKKLGIFAFSDEKFKQVRSNGGKAAVQKQKEIGSGIFGLSKTELSENGKKAGAVTCSQRWKCLGCEMITTIGNIANHQKSSKHEGKERVS